ncbi:MAG TPA: DUF72 domain-containing protein [Gemmatimonadales bacterium]|nr:DUF72 domain-containing protein [Gemmatimonadales bacterium]
MPTFVGTSGWSYKEWRGSFYPAKFPAHGMLSYYAERFRAVEVNNSFYRIPSERVLAGWAEQVPAHFRFVMKASRRITHNRRLRDDDGSLAYFLRAVNPLGGRLGPTLFQLPPTFQLDLSRLRDFLERLPKRWPAAVEFRHPSWFVDEVYELLHSRDIPLVTVDEHREGREGTPLVPTASWGYLRLRRGNYSSADLANWADRIEAQGWTEVYLFLKHEEGSPTGPAAAQELNAILTARER